MNAILRARGLDVANMGHNKFRERKDSSSLSPSSSRSSPARSEPANARSPSPQRDTQRSPPAAGSQRPPAPEREGGKDPDTQLLVTLMKALQQCLSDDKDKNLKGDEKQSPAQSSKKSPTQEEKEADRRSMPPPAPVQKPKAASRSTTSGHAGPEDLTNVTPSDPKKRTRDSRTPTAAPPLATPSPAPKRQNVDEDSDDEILRQPVFDVDGDDVARNKAAQREKRNSTGSGFRSDPLDLFEFLDQAAKNSTSTADPPRTPQASSSSSNPAPPSSPGSSRTEDKGKGRASDPPPHSNTAELELLKKRLAEAESSIESVNKNVQNLLSMSTKRGKSTWHDRGTLDTRARRALTGCIRSAKTGDNLYVISLGSDDLYCYQKCTVLEYSAGKVDCAADGTDDEDGDMIQAEKPWCFREESKAQRAITELNDVLKTQDEALGE